MGVNSLPKTVTGQRRGCYLNSGPSAPPESSTLTDRLPSQPVAYDIANQSSVGLKFSSCQPQRSVLGHSRDTTLSLSKSHLTAVLVTSGADN